MTARPAHLHRRASARMAGAISQAIDRIEPGPEAQRIDALLVAAEAHIERAAKLLRDAESGARQMRRPRATDIAEAGDRDHQEAPMQTSLEEAPARRKPLTKAQQAQAAALMRSLLLKQITERDFLERLEAL